MNIAKIVLSVFIVGIFSGCAVQPNRYGGGEYGFNPYQVAGAGTGALAGGAIGAAVGGGQGALTGALIGGAAGALLSGSDIGGSSGYNVPPPVFYSPPVYYTPPVYVVPPPVYYEPRYYYPDQGGYRGSKYRTPEEWRRGQCTQYGIGCPHRRW
jgi:hypothetical protein